MSTWGTDFSVSDGRENALDPHARTTISTAFKHSGPVVAVVVVWREASRLAPPSVHTTIPRDSASRLLGAFPTLSRLLGAPREKGSATLRHYCLGPKTAPSSPSDGPMPCIWALDSPRRSSDPSTCSPASSWIIPFFQGCFADFQ